MPQNSLNIEVILNAFLAPAQNHMVNVMANTAIGAVIALQYSNYHAETITNIFNKIKTKRFNELGMRELFGVIGLSQLVLPSAMITSIGLRGACTILSPIRTPIALSERAMRFSEYAQSLGYLIAPYAYHINAAFIGSKVLQGYINLLFSSEHSIASSAIKMATIVTPLYFLSRQASLLIADSSGMATAFGALGVGYLGYMGYSLYSAYENSLYSAIYCEITRSRIQWSEVAKKSVEMAAIMSAAYLLDNPVIPVIVSLARGERYAEIFRDVKALDIVKGLAIIGSSAYLFNSMLVPAAIGVALCRKNISKIKDLEVSEILKNVVAIGGIVTSNYFSSNPLLPVALSLVWGKWYDGCVLSQPSAIELKSYKHFGLMLPGMLLTSALIATTALAAIHSSPIPLLTGSAAIITGLGTVAIGFQETQERREMRERV